MAYDIRKEAVWVAEMQDRPGALSEKLAALNGNENLEFVIARRAWNKDDGAVVFVAPIHGAGPMKAARSVGFEKALGMHSLRIEGPDKPGLGAQAAHMLAEAGINLRGFSAASLGKHCAMYFAFATEADQEKAERVLRKAFGK